MRMAFSFLLRKLLIKTSKVFIICQYYFILVKCNIRTVSSALLNIYIHLLETVLAEKQQEQYIYVGHKLVSTDHNMIRKIAL